MKGKGFSITLINCNLQIADNEIELCNVVDNIIDLIGMKSLSDFKIGIGKDEMPGISVLKIIETSHVALHGFSINDVYMFNLESCKDFDEHLLFAYLLEKFDPNDYDINALYEIDTKVSVIKRPKR